MHQGDETLGGVFPAVQKVSLVLSQAAQQVSVSNELSS